MVLLAPGAFSSISSRSNAAALMQKGSLPRKISVKYASFASTASAACSRAGVPVHRCHRELNLGANISIAQLKRKNIHFQLPKLLERERATFDAVR